MKRVMAIKADESSHGKDGLLPYGKVLNEALGVATPTAKEKVDVQREIHRDAAGDIEAVPYIERVVFNPAFSYVGINLVRS